MDKKYELLDDTMDFNGITLHRIKALKDFGDVKAGDIGGYIEKEENLSHEGNCWIGEEAKVYEYAEVSEDAQVLGEAVIHEYGKIYGNAVVAGNSKVHGYAKIYENAHVHENAKVCDYAEVFGNAEAHEYADISGFSKVYGDTVVGGEQNKFDREFEEEMARRMQEENAEGAVVE